MGAPAKAVVDAARAVQQTAPAAGSFEAPPLPVVPAYYFRNSSTEGLQLVFEDGRTFRFGGRLAWGTDDPVLGKQIATVAARHGLEVVSIPH